MKRQFKEKVLVSLDAFAHKYCRVFRLIDSRHCSCSNVGQRLTLSVVAIKSRLRGARHCLARLFGAAVRDFSDRARKLDQLEIEFPFFLQEQTMPAILEADYLCAADSLGHLFSKGKRANLVTDRMKDRR